MQKIERGNFCPLLKKECIGLKCNWFIQVRGKHPQTGEDLDHWDCSVSWLPTLLINNANETRQGAAAIESFRNEMVNANNLNAQLLAENIRATDSLKDEVSKTQAIASDPTIYSITKGQ